MTVRVPTHSRPGYKCMPKHCLCGAISTKADPPETGRRVQAYGNRWEFITWHNGDQEVFSLWRDDMDQHPCEKVVPGHHENQNQQLRLVMDDEQSRTNISPVRWMPIDVKCTFLPDRKKKYLVYDGFLKDVVMAVSHYPKNFKIGDNPGNILWFDKSTHFILQDSKWWTDVPFPEGEK